MDNKIILQDKIMNVNEQDLNQLIFEVYRYQLESNKVFNKFVRFLGLEKKSPQRLEEIPFLPVEIFKSQDIKAGKWEAETIFESSGTQQLGRSKHHVKSIKFYHDVAQHCFEFHYGPLDHFEFVGLLPNYLESPNSSLVSMVNYFVNKANRFSKEVFFLHDFHSLNKLLNDVQEKNRKIILFGVSFALLDFVKEYKINNSDLIIIETGGMKGRRSEIEREVLISELQIGFPHSKIHSEYGMTELHSQAYAMDGMYYSAPPFLKFLISEPTDPMNFLECGQRGIINIIDLANLNTCSFLQTEDIGMLNEQGQLRVYGRYNSENLRGCVQMYEGQ